MDVFLVPIAGDRYALYSEQVTPAGAPLDEPSTFVSRVQDRLRRALADNATPNDSSPQSVVARVRQSIARRFAKVVAEQQLLWHLRRPTDARLVHPDDLTRTDAVDAMRALLTHERDRHRKWAVIDALFAVGTTPAALLPGPNVFAYYFAFRMVGHWLAQNGASRGLTTMAWQVAASPHLTAVRAALPLGGDVRHAALTTIAVALGLTEASRFAARIAPDDGHAPAGRAG